MSKLYLLTLQALCQTFEKQAATSLYKLFPKEVEIELLGNPKSYALPKSLFDVESIFASIHYSWLLSHLEKYPASERTFFFSSLPKILQEGLSQMMQPKLYVIPLSPLAKNFFLQKMTQDWLTSEKSLPKEFIEPTPLKELLNLTKLQLVTLIDYLGIQDLSIDLRKVLDKKVLEEINQKLSAQQKSYLNFCLKKGDLPLIKPEMISFWQKDPTVFANLIQQKGLARCAAGLAHESQDLIWHISHLLDIGRGKELMKQLKEREIAKIPPKLKAQVAEQLLNLAAFLKKEVKG